MLTEAGLVYFAEQREKALIKMGFSTEVGRRLSVLSAQHGPLKLLAVMPGTKQTETWMHVCFGAERTEREWFTKSDRLLQFLSVISEKALVRREMEVIQCPNPLCSYEWATRKKGGAKKCPRCQAKLK